LKHSTSFNIFQHHSTIVSWLGLELEPLPGIYWVCTSAWLKRGPVRLILAHWSMVFQRAKANPCPEDDQVNNDQVVEAKEPAEPMVEPEQPKDLDAILAKIQSASGEIMHSIDQDEALRDADPENKVLVDVGDAWHVGDVRKGSDSSECI
jgi:hypothetical protein